MTNWLILLKILCLPWKVNIHQCQRQALLAQNKHFPAPVVAGGCSARRHQACMTSNDPKELWKACTSKGTFPLDFLPWSTKAWQTVADPGSSAVQDITVKKCTIKLLFHAQFIGAGSPCWAGKKRGELFLMSFVQTACVSVRQTPYRLWQESKDIEIKASLISCCYMLCGHRTSPYSQSLSKSGGFKPTVCYFLSVTGRGGGIILFPSILNACADYHLNFLWNPAFRVFS